MFHFQKLFKITKIYSILTISILELTTGSGFEVSDDLF